MKTLSAILTLLIIAGCATSPSTTPPPAVASASPAAEAAPAAPAANAITLPTPPGATPQVVQVTSASISKTNQPPSNNFAWTPGDSNWSYFTFFAGHASGQWQTNLTVRSTNATMTNFNFSPPWVMAVSQTDSNGLTSALSAELWLNAPSNGIAYHIGTNLYLGFETVPGFTYRVSGVMGTATNVIATVTSTSNAFQQVKIPQPGFYRLARQ